MTVLVTGATGFVGANTARLLVAEGYQVRVLARRSSSLRALEGCAVEVVRGDICDLASVGRAIEGCAQVFHVAADYRLWARDPTEVYRNNVDGTTSRTFSRTMRTCMPRPRRPCACAGCSARA